MQKQSKKTISISLSVLGLALLLLCAVLPVFSFWNYRLCMFLLVPISLISFLSCTKEKKTKFNVIGGCLILAFSCIAAFIGKPMTSAFICAIIGVLTAIVMIAQDKLVILQYRTPSIILESLIAIVAFASQSNTISSYYDSYEKALSGSYDVPAHVADSMLTAAFNETGMMIAVLCLFLSFAAVCMKSAYRAEAETSNAHDILSEVSSTETVIRYCGKCGSKLMADSCFCGHCGAEIRKKPCDTPAFIDNSST